MLLGAMVAMLQFGIYPVEATSHTIDVTVGTVEDATSEDEQSAISTPDTGEFKQTNDAILPASVGLSALVAVILVTGFFVFNKKS